MKKFWIFLAGFVSGAAVLFAVLMLIAKGADNNSSQIDGLTLFEQPGEVMTARSYCVFQVVEEGHALALSDLGVSDELPIHLGPVVLLYNDNNTPYYDQQIIRVPKGKTLRQIGTYQYETEESYKTVPVVKMFDK